MATPRFSERELWPGYRGLGRESSAPMHPRTELFEPSTAMSGLHPAIESRSQSLSEWLIPVIAGIVLVAF